MSERTASESDPTLGMVPKLLSLAKAMRALHGMKLAELGFHNGQDELLLSVDGIGITTSALAETLSVRPSTVSKMMDRLVEKGLVERVADRRDKRRTLVRITPAGIVARQELVEARRELEAELARALPEEGRATVIASLVECQMHLKGRLRRLR